VPYLAKALELTPHYAWKNARKNGVVQSVSVSVKDLLTNCRLVDANKIAFVPKTAKTHRSIAVEPLANGFLQKGVDNFMRRRLKRVGIDLSDQTLNQEMARQGSALWEWEDPFCTLDLTSASDSISVSLVKEVLPPDWFALLDRIRSPSYDLHGATYRSEKFCTMGNGFCFPLETMLFASVCHAITGGRAGVDFMVYGDDIIVRRKFYESVVLFLKRIGFRPNVKKSFDTGPFRESCGANWYAGEDVTPFTLDYALDSLKSLFKFANLARRNTRSKAYLHGCICLVIRQIPDPFLLWRPFKGASDTGLDPVGVEFYPLPCTCRSAFKTRRGTWTKEWVELKTDPVTDPLAYPPWVVMAAIMRNIGSPTPFEKLFTFRRKTRTRVTRVSRSGDLCQISDEPLGVTPERYALIYRHLRVARGLSVAP
jgi:hypothetical protein